MSFESFHYLQPEPILNDRLPDEVEAMTLRDRLPGVGPVSDGKWLTLCDVFSQQMRQRDKLIANERARVLIERNPVSDAALELFDFTLDALKSMPGYKFDRRQVVRPDGVEISLDIDTPLATLGRLVQEDLLILNTSPEGHVLSEGVLCFPSGWTFAEKAGHPLGRIHMPVENYTADIEKRVQRLFDAVRPGQVIARANHIHHDNYHLFQPFSEHSPRHDTENATYLRVERQCIFKLPQSSAAVFSIHSYVIKQTRNKDL